MRTIFLTLIVIGGLIFASGSIVVLVKLVRQTKATDNRQVAIKTADITLINPADITVNTVLQAHGVDKDKAGSAFKQDAILTYYEESPTGPKPMAQQELNFSTDGSLFRLDKTIFNTTPNRTQSFLFNGQTLVQTTREGGTQLDAKVPDNLEVAFVKFQMDSFDLLPVLRHLWDPSMQVVYLGVTSKGNQFLIKTAVGDRFFYTDSNNLIVRFEADETNITYSDYRTFDGLNLPFQQHVKKGDKLLYEIKFGAYDFNPVFAPEHFKSGLL